MLTHPPHLKGEWPLMSMPPHPPPVQWTLLDQARRLHPPTLTRRILGLARTTPVLFKRTLRMKLPPVTLP